MRQRRPIIRDPLFQVPAIFVGIAAIVTLVLKVQPICNSQSVWWSLGITWIALMWTLVLPLDRWILQGWLKKPFNLAGKLALGNAFFWTALTPGLIWRLSSFSFLTLC
jgi:hypothetical protein